MEITEEYYIIPPKPSITVIEDYKTKQRFFNTSLGSFELVRVEPNDPILIINNVKMIANYDISNRKFYLVNYIGLFELSSIIQSFIKAINRGDFN